MPHEARWSRREFLMTLGAAALGPAACVERLPDEPDGGSARLTARPGSPGDSVTPGTWPLGLGPETYDGFLHVPASYVHGTPMPLVLSLHGAGTRAMGPIQFRRPYAESHGFLVLSVDSVGVTWDAIYFVYRTDVEFIDRALSHVFERCSVDPDRIIVEGFSDGASYALGLGLSNGDLFRRVVAFSPGFIPAFDNPLVGKPEFFFSHGVLDPVLRVQYASRPIVADLRAGGYEVEYHEFQGGHTIPPEIATLASDWLIRP
jgi:predicted esterase